LFTSNTVAGIDIFLLGDEMHISYVLLQKKDEKVTVLGKQTGFKKISEIAENIPENIPIQLCVNGKGVVSRKIESKPTDSIDEIMHQVIPGADIRLMYYTLSENKENQSIEINIVRKEIIDPILLEFKNFNLFVTQINPGTSALVPIISLLDAETIVSKHYSITPNEISGYKIASGQSEQPSSHLVADERTDGDYILPFGAAIGWFLKHQSQDTNFQKITTENNEEFYAFKKLKFTIVTGLSFIFIVLLINFLSFGALTKKNNNLNSFLSRYKNEMEKVVNLKQEVRIKEKYLYENNLLSGTKMSYYSDRIALLVPKEIVLSELNIHPGYEKTSGSKNISSFQLNKIKIEGRGSIENLQEFILSLEKELWISDVDLENYNTDKRSRTVLFSLIAFIQ
jgi:hypothetical protein